MAENEKDRVWDVRTNERETEPAYRNRLERDRQMTAGCDGAATGYQETAQREVPISHELTLDNVEDAFQYHPWGVRQAASGAQVREALVAAAKAVLRNVPRSPLRTRALNMLVDARMLVNMAITHDVRL